MKYAHSFHDAKLAALFSEYVVPYSLMHNFHQDKIRLGMESSASKDPLEVNAYTNYLRYVGTEEIAGNILPPKLWLKPKIWADLVTSLIEEGFHGTIQEILPDKRHEKKLSTAIKKRNDALEEIWKVVPPDECIVESSAQFTTNEGINKRIFLALSEVSMIDTDNLDWKEIIEFRKDKDSAIAFRRLRHFATENYQGKSVSFIQDDIQLRREDFENTVRRWGFSTTLGAIETAFSSKVLAGAATASLASALLGAPSTAIVSAAAGVLFEMGSLTVRVIQSQDQNQTLQRESPIGYLKLVQSLNKEAKLTRFPSNKRRER